MGKSIARPLEVLQSLSPDNLAGALVISDPQDLSVRWKLYIHHRTIAYATSLLGQNERLNCLWQQFQGDLSLPALTSSESDYAQLQRWGRAQQLPLATLPEFFARTSQEAIAQVLAFEPTAIEFFPHETLDLPFRIPMGLDVLNRSQQLSEQWQQIRAVLPSPFSRLYLDPSQTYAFYKSWQAIDSRLSGSKVAHSGKISFWLQLLSQKLCLYEIATQVGINPLHLASEFIPLFKANVLQILPFQEQPLVPAIIANDNRTFSINSLGITPTFTASSGTAIATRQTVAISQYENATSLPQQQITNLSRTGINNPTPSVNNPENDRPLVACIDDSKTVQRQVQLTLESVGYQVLNITEPASTLTLLVRQKPGIILLDINMPEIDGYELCQMLHRSRKLKEIPIVMLTGRDGIVDRVRAKLVGANHYLTKPFDPNQLIEVVQKLALTKNSF